MYFIFFFNFFTLYICQQIIFISIKMFYPITLSGFFFGGGGIKNLKFDITLAKLYKKYIHKRTWKCILFTHMNHQFIFISKKDIYLFETHFEDVFLFDKWPLSFYLGPKIFPCLFLLKILLLAITVATCNGVPFVCYK